MSKSRQQQWSPDGCTLLPIVRDLIERAYFATSGKGNEDYQIVWMPDLPLGAQKLRVAHDCRSMPRKLLGGDKQKRLHSMGHMNVYGEMYMMCEAPMAGYAIYQAACHYCQSVFFVSAWDKEDTLENYVKKLKAGK